MHFDMDELRRLQEDDLVNLIADPHSDLLIANYAPKAQYAHMWDEHPILLDCRGTILRPDGTVYAKPFRKFFNAGERPGTSLDELACFGVPEISHKRDGSMITLFADPTTGRVRCATRGSFASDQAKAAERLWYATYGGFTPPKFDQFTYVFEYTAPDNRIVVSYTDAELVLIGLVDNETGVEDSYEWISRIAQGNGLAWVALECDLSVLAEARPNFEGYVLYWPEQRVRVKVKLEEYVRLHRIITGVNERRIWEVLCAGDSFDELLARVPDEFNAWVRTVITRLDGQYAEWEALAVAAHGRIKDLPTRKEQALALQREPTRAVVFKMLDKKPYASLIWKELDPGPGRPFVEADV